MNESLEHTHDFSRKKRLVSAKDYKIVFDNVSFKIHQPNFFCLVAVQSSNPSLFVKQENSRLGLAISKAKNKRAHERNRIKRLVREYFRLHQHELIEPVDMVFMVKTKTDDLSNATIYQQLDASFRKINKKLTSSHPPVKHK